MFLMIYQSEHNKVVMYRCLSLWFFETLELLHWTKNWF